VALPEMDVRLRDGAFEIVVTERVMNRIVLVIDRGFVDTAPRSAGGTTGVTVGFPAMKWTSL
jgi:hypothetical protein